MCCGVFCVGCFVGFWCNFFFVDVDVLFGVVGGVGGC